MGRERHPRLFCRPLRLAVFSPERLLTQAIPSFVAGFTSILSIGDFATATLMHPEHGVGFIKTTSPFYLVLAIPVAFLAYFVGRQISRSHPDYFRFAAALKVVFALIMTAVFVRGSEVSLEDRHFRQIGLVLAIGFVLCRPWLAAALQARRRRPGTGSARLWRHHLCRQAAVAHGTSLLVVPSAEVGLEFPGRRVVEIPANFRAHDELRTRYSYRGRVDRLGMLVQTEDVENGQASLVLAAFKDYPLNGWTVTPLGNITYCSQGR